MQLWREAQRWKKSQVNLDTSSNEYCNQNIVHVHENSRGKLLKMPKQQRASGGVTMVQKLSSPTSSEGDCGRKDEAGDGDGRRGPGAAEG